MRTPAYRLTLGEQIVDTTDEPLASTVTRLEVSLDLEPRADRFLLDLGRVGSFEPRVGDRAVLELGYADSELVEVMRGAVVSRRPGIHTVEIRGHGLAQDLLHFFTDRTFLGTTAGGIVRALADGAGVAVARVEDGPELPAYVVDGRLSAYRHMAELAELSGFDLYLNAAGELVFERFAGGQTAHVFASGEHLLALETRDSARAAGEVEAWGEGPGAGRGEHSWAWLSKNFGPRRGSAGSGEPVRRLRNPALRTAAAAQPAALALHRALEAQRLRGRLLAPGRPEVKLGDSIRLRSLPDEDRGAFFPGTFFQVCAVHHSLTKAGGLTTAVDFRSLPEGAS
ncbi:MAG: hypothetical protein AAF725_22220 [Acidobacteriota bacterium]